MDGFERRLYPNYADSGIDWLGAIPSHWRIRRLRFECEVNPPKKHLTAASSDLEVSFVPMETIGEDGSLRLSETRPIGEVSEGYTCFQDDDVLVAKITPCFENGKGALASDLCNGIGFGTTELHVLRPHDGISSAFLHYLTRTVHFRILGTSWMYGAAGQQRIPERFIKDFPCLTPPPNEQDAIVNYIDAKTVNIDALIAKKQRLIELLNEKRAAIIRHAVTKGLDPTVPMKDSGIEWLGEIPTHWQVLKLGMRADVTKLTGFEYTNHWETDPNGEIIALRGFNIKDRSLNLEDTELISSSLSLLLKRSKLKAGDIVMPCTGTLGDAALIGEDDKFHINQNIAKISASDAIDCDFLVFLLTSAEMKVQIDLHNSSGMQPVLLIGTIRNLLMQLPPKCEQSAIAAYLSKVDERFNRSFALINKQITLFSEYREALITAAVTGKIDVRNHVPETIETEFGPIMEESG